MVRLPRGKTHVVAGMVLISICSVGEALAQSDPGVRGGTAGAGGALPGLSATELSFFNAAADVFAEVDTVSGGLGPRFNLDSCAGCHVQPTVGGSSPAVNPQIAVANQAHNTIPSFVTLNGPIREASRAARAGSCSSKKSARRPGPWPEATGVMSATSVPMGVSSGARSRIVSRAICYRRPFSLAQRRIVA